MFSGGLQCAYRFIGVYRAFQGVFRAFQGLHRVSGCFQGVSGCFQRFTGVSGCFRVLTEVYMGFRVFQGVFRVYKDVYRGLQGLTESSEFYRKKTKILLFNLYYKTRQRLLQNAAALLLHNEAKVITKRGRYYKTRQRILQNAADISKRVNYCKMWQCTCCVDKRFSDQ